MKETIESILKQEFKTKEEYLAWVLLWKETYAKLTAAIRQIKSGVNYEKNCKEFYNKSHVFQHERKIPAKELLAARRRAKRQSWEMKLQGMATRLASTPQ